MPALGSFAKARRQWAQREDQVTYEHAKTDFRRMPRYAFSLILLAFLVAAPAGHAAGENAAGEDFVSLTSGNRMTGTVRGLERGELRFAIDGVGPVDIDWNNVEALRSGQGFDIELASGERLAGSIAAAGPGRLRIVTTSGPRTVDRDDVVRMTRIAETFRGRTTGFADLGFDFLTANDEIDLTLNAGVRHRTRNHLFHAHLSSLVRRRDDETEQRRNHLELGARRFLRDRWFVLGQIEAQEDIELDLDSRFLLAGALGRTLLQSNRTTLSVYGGIDYAFEEYRSLPGSDDYAEALAAVEWDWFEVGGRTELLTKAKTYFSLERSRTRLELTASLHRKLFGDFYWGLNVIESYDSDPPADLEKSDSAVTLTFGSTF